MRSAASFRSSNPHCLSFTLPARPSIRPSSLPCHSLPSFSPPIPFSLRGTAWHHDLYWRPVSNSHRSLIISHYRRSETVIGITWRSALQSVTCSVLIRVERVWVGLLAMGWHRWLRWWFREIRSWPPCHLVRCSFIWSVRLRWRAHVRINASFLDCCVIVLTLFLTLHLLVFFRFFSTKRWKLRPDLVRERGGLFFSDISYKCESSRFLK